MAKQYINWFNFLDAVKQNKQLFIRQTTCSEFYKETGYYAMGTISSRGVWVESKQPPAGRRILSEDFHSGQVRIYDEKPDDFNGLVLYEEDTDLNFARFQGKANGKLKIVFCANGEAVSDAKAKAFAEKAIARYKAKYPIDYTVHIGTSTMLNCFELRVIDGTIPAENVEFYLDDTQLEFDICKGIKISDDNMFVGLTIQRELLRAMMEKTLEIHGMRKDT
jgi:hypothetical protein